MFKIVTLPHPSLRQVAPPITTITPEVKAFAAKLLDTLSPKGKDSIGVGLAATQVNSTLRMFAMLTPDKKHTIMINPRLLKANKKLLSSLPEDKQFLEGCLSIPGYWGFVDRPIKIKVSYTSLKGLTKTVTLTPPFSTYFQHELDHLNGVLFIDHIKAQSGQLYKADAKGKLKPVKITSMETESQNPVLS